MDLGKYQLVLSVSVILAAAVVALLFDYLKRNNEQLRQANREMKARRSQELRQMRLRENAAGKASPVPVAEPKAKVEAAPVNKLAEPVAARVAAAAEPKAIAQPEAAPEMKMGIRVSTPEVAKVAEVAAVAPEVPAAKRDWNSLLKTARPEDRSEPSLAEQALGKKAILPVGFHTEATLSELLRQDLKVTGTAVSIYASFAAERMPEAVSSFVATLLEPADFGARRGDNEFVLILKDELNAPSQKRLNSIGQRLWDFQLEGSESHGASFHWAGEQVNGVTLEEALQTATERMSETKRNRKVLPIEMRERRPELRRAV